MYLSFIPPRQVKIGDAASFVGITPRAIRHYHAIGLLPEPERGSDNRRRYGYGEMIRLLWIRKMADAGIALDDIRDAFADAPQAGADSDQGVAGILERLERTLTAKEAELQRQRSVVARMRTRGNKMGLLSDFVASRLESLPEGSLRDADLDNLLVIEKIFGPLGAAVNADRYIALATHPGLREESDRVDAAEGVLDDTIAVDDPLVAQVAAERYAFELAIHAVMEGSGSAQSDDALFDAWEALHTESAGEDKNEAGEGSGMGRQSSNVFEAVGKMPYDWSPARLRSIELAEEMAARELPAP
jgi:DNA-binding transcriptional MerR regulator